MAHFSHATTNDQTQDSVAESGTYKSASFVGLVVSQALGQLNDNILRWFAVPLAAPVVGLEKALVVGGLCLTLPFLLFMPLAGWVADRFPKRSVVVSCKVAELILMTLSVFAMIYGHAWMLFLLVFLLGTQAALSSPAKFGCIPEMIPTRELSHGNGIMAMAVIFSAGLGTVAGYPIYGMTKPELGSGNVGPFIPIACILIVVSLLGLLSSLLIRFRPGADPGRGFSWNPVTSMGPPLKAIWHDKPFLSAAFGIAFFFFVASIAQQNLPRYAEHVLHLPEIQVGLLLGILIVGFGAGSLLAGFLSDGKIELGLVPVGAGGIFAGCILTFVAGLTATGTTVEPLHFSYWGSCLGILLIGTSAGLFSVPLEAFIQHRSDSKKRGMLLAGNFLLTYIFITLSLGVFYILSDEHALSLSSTVIFLIGGLMTLPVVILAIRILPDWTLRFMIWALTRLFYKVRIHREEHVPSTGPAVVVVNHVSFMDGPVMMTALKRMTRFIIYSHFTQMPVLSAMGRTMRVIPIRASEGPKSLIQSLRLAREALESGEVVCIFAEGGLSRSGQLQPFQRGLAKIVHGMDVPIVPAYLEGLWGSIFSWKGGRPLRKWPKQWRLRVDLFYGEPVRQFEDIAEIRLAVERLGAEAATMNSKTLALIPARRFIRHCKATRGKRKIFDSTNVELSGTKLLTAALAMRKVLRAHALSPEEKNVGLLLPPSAGGSVANMALALDQRVSVNLNYTLSEEVIQNCIDKAGIKHVLTSRKFLEKKPYTIRNAEFVFLEDLRPKISGFTKIVSLLQAALVPSAILDRLLGLQKVSAESPLTIIFTSGSTGEPKGVVLSHANIGSNIKAIDDILNLTESDAILGILPFFHSFGYTACLWLPMCYRARAIYHVNPLDAKVVGKMAEDHKVTIMMATPTFLKMYMRACKRENFATVNLIVVGAEKLPVDLANEFEQRFGILPTEGYGTSELSPVVAVNIPDSRCKNNLQPAFKLGTVGRPIPGVTAKVVDPDTFVDRGIGVEGLLLIQGPNVMTGYLDEPEKTAELIKDGWYNTGDFAVLDKEGFISITGRQSRFSKIAGEMVPHIRIEQELLKICEPEEDQEALANLVVTSVPDQNRGERIVVLYRSITKPVDEVLKELAQTGLPKLWLPSSNSFAKVPEIPILGTGKLDLKGIKDVALKTFNQEAGAKT